MNHKHKWVLRYKHRMHKDEWKWCCTGSDYCFATAPWWAVWVLLGFRVNPFEKIPDYAIFHREPKLHESVICALTGHNHTKWEPRIGWSFFRICRTCRSTQYEFGENMKKVKENEIRSRLIQGYQACKAWKEART